ncbi:hypothetical protein OHV78_17240 [Acinetobacter baumannii]|uniref:hypothetical protein n=1 Tax=Acinetobacter baumannii TaxID=470 RepID=UPI0023414036|nr:hypothetical protein [Acinetobacter baumannii]
MKKLIKGIALTTFAVLLTACSKPDISGVWIPEKVAKDEVFFDYYIIEKKKDSDRYLLKNVTYRIKGGNSYRPMKLPKLIGGQPEKVLEFIKDDTYCVEGSLQTECVVYTDGKLDFYNQGTFVKSKKNPPEIPVNQ